MHGPTQWIVDNHDQPKAINKQIVALKRDPISEGWYSAEGVPHSRYGKHCAGGARDGIDRSLIHPRCMEVEKQEPSPIFRG